MDQEGDMVFLRMDMDYAGSHVYFVVSHVTSAPPSTDLARGRGCTSLIKALTTSPFDSFNAAVAASLLHPICAACARHYCHYSNLEENLGDVQ